jgi:hypothetical protein
MIKELIEKWDQNKDKLEEYFKNTRQSEYDSYEKIVKLIFKKCEIDFFNVEQMTVIDHGNYSGNMLFIIPKATYDPGIDDYIVCCNSYGSCSGCDTLEAIHFYEYGTPSSLQLKDYMTLSLHLIQKFKYIQDDNKEEKKC